MSAEQEQLRRKLKRLEQNQRSLDARLTTVENSLLFRTLRRGGQFWLGWKRKAGQLLLHSPLHPLYLKIASPASAQSEYRRWLERESTPSLREFSRRPLISIVMPVHNPRREWLEAAIQSVQNQTYTSWELCVCDDASVQDYFADVDPRIRFVRSDEHLGISGALNRAGGLAQGEYVAFLDQDDVLPPYALHYVAEALQQSSPDLIYSDEDKLDASEERTQPIFKPDWSPDLLLSCMYFGHLLVVSKAALDRVGWFRSDFDGSQDYDLALRLSDADIAVHHIPRILYHWRRHAESTAESPGAKPHTHAAGRRALKDTIKRRGWAAEVEDGPLSNTYHLRRRVGGDPAVSLIICSRNASLLKRCLSTLAERTSFAKREVIVVEHKTPADPAMDRLLANSGCVRVPYEGRFNFSEMNNRGARSATSEFLVFLNDDVEPITPDWLGSMIAHLQRPGIGIVGAKLLYPLGSIQHAGIVTGMMDATGHPLRGAFASTHWHFAELTRNVSAVTGACLAVTKSVFHQLGGFDPIFPVNYNDVDFCLRAHEAEFAIIFEPAAVLLHRECQTRPPGTQYEERELFYERWGHVLERPDPFYSPNLTRVREDTSLRLED